MDIQTVSVVLGGIGIFIAAINFVISSRKADQQRQMDLFTRIYDHIVTETFSQHFQDVMNRKPIKYEAGREIQLSNPDVASQEGYINRLIVYVCVVINKGLIDIELVDDLIAMPIIQYWDRVEPWYREWRKESQDPTLGDDIEAAYHRLKQRREHQVTVAKQRLSAANA